MKSGNTLASVLGPRGKVIQSLRFHWQSSSTSICQASNCENRLVQCTQSEEVESQVESRGGSMSATSSGHSYVHALVLSLSWLSLFLCQDRDWHLRKLLVKGTNCYFSHTGWELSSQRAYSLVASFAGEGKALIPAF